MISARRLPSARRPSLAWPFRVRPHLPVQRVQTAFHFAIVALWIAFLECLTPLVAVALAPLFYWRLLVGDARDAATLPTGDISDLHYPYRRWVAEQVARGIQPWWNEFVSGGHSAIGDIQFHTLYPPDQWLAQWSGGAFPIVTLELGIIGHVALAALFTYLLVRRLSGSRIGGLVGAVVFAFGGYLSGFPVQQMIILETSIWLPLVLLAVDIGADYSLLTAFVLGAAGIALAALAGHPQTLFYVLLAAALYGLFKTWRRGRVQPVVPVGMAILGLGGLALAAAALFPAFAHLALTDRTDVTYDFSRGGFQLHEALGLILPSGFGGAALYHGVASLLLVAVALTSPFRRSNKLFWLALGILGLLFSFGGNTFLQGPIYVALGSFKFRDHERTSFYVAMAIAVLAGYGAAELTRFRPPRLNWLSRGFPFLFGAVAVALTLIVVLSTTTTQNNSQAITNLLNQATFATLMLSLGSAIVYARWRRLLRPAVAGLLIVSVVTMDLFSANWQNNLTPGDPNQFLAASPIASYLEDYTNGQFRISSEGLLPGDGNAGMLDRLEDIAGNSPLETKAYHDFDQDVPEITRWQILDVRYVITKRKLDHPQIHLLRQDGAINLYELDPAMRFPRAYLVDEVVPVASQQAAFDLLKDDDLRNAAVVENVSPDVATALPIASDTFGPTGPPATSANGSTAQVTSSDGDTETVTVDAARDSFLVLSEVDYPGWQASVDGASTPIYRTNGIVRGVFVAAGQHTVRFWFVPPGLAEGQALSSQAIGWLKIVVIVDLVLHVVWLAVREVLRRGWLRRPRLPRRAAAKAIAQTPPE